MRALVAMAALLAGSCASAVEDKAEMPPAWPEAVLTFASTQHMAAVAAQFPNSAGMQRRLLAAAVEAKDAAAALAAARRLAALGGSLSENGRRQVAAVTGAEAMAALAPLFDANTARAGSSEVHALIPAEHRLIEGLIWDRNERRLYATSVVDRRLLRLETGGAATMISGPGVGSLFGGAYEPAAGRLWIASAAIEQTPPGDSPFNGLLAIDPRRPGLGRRIPAPDGATLGDVAVGPDGIVYASDGQKGAVYRCRPGCAALEAWLPPGTFRSAQGMAVSADRRWLYVADYRYGLAAVELASGRVHRVEGSPEMMLDGIDGLVRHGRDLIAIQNGVLPVRIVRLVLSTRGPRVERLEILERGNPDWGEPSLGTMVGDRFLYVADPQWERYGPGGVAADDKPPRPTPIRAIALGR
jgi:hypothetical protein